MLENYERRLVKLAELNVDMSYQREARPHQKGLLRNFMDAAFLDLVVGEREDKTLWIVDGRQRRDIALHEGIKKSWARIIPESTQESEARLFVVLNGGIGTVVRPRPGELFKAKMTAKDPVALAVDRAVTAAGLRLRLTGGSRAWPELGCVGIIYDLTSLYGEEKSIRAFKLLAETWTLDDQAMDDAVVGACLNIVGYFPSLDDCRFKEVFTKIPARCVVQASRVKSDGWARRRLAYEFIREKYNKGRRNEDKKIPAWGLAA